LLLINPKFPESFWSFSWTFNRIVRDKKALSTPLGRGTLAALCPSGWDIRILDENSEGAGTSSPQALMACARHLKSSSEPAWPNREYNEHLFC